MPFKKSSLLPHVQDIVSWLDTGSLESFVARHSMVLHLASSDTSHARNAPKPLLLGYALPNIVLFCLDDAHLRQRPWQQRLWEGLQSVLRETWAESSTTPLAHLTNFNMFITHKYLQDDWCNKVSAFPSWARQDYARVVLDTMLLDNLELFYTNPDPSLCNQHFLEIAMHAYPSGQPPTESTLGVWQKMCATIVRRQLPTHQSQLFQKRPSSNIDATWMRPLLNELHAQTWGLLSQSMSASHDFVLRQYYPANDFDALHAMPSWTSSFNLSDLLQRTVPNAHAALTSSGLLQEEDWSNMALIQTIAYALNPANVASSPIPIALPTEMEP